MPDHYGLTVNGSVQEAATGGGNTPLESRMVLGPHMMNRFDLQDQYLAQQDDKFNNSHSFKKHAAATSNSLWRHHRGIGTRSIVNLNAAPAPSYFMEGDKINVMGSHYENGLFSSSLSDLFTRKLRLSSNNNGVYGHSVGTGGGQQYEEEDEAAAESLEEIEAQTIGNLLPNDDDLFSGITDGFDYVVKQQASSGDDDDGDDLDFFSSVGGMDMGEDVVYSSNEHPHGEHPSRTLFVRNINSSVEDSELRSLFEQYGDIRTLYTACKHRGFVMISYYDIRAARNAMKALQDKPLRRRKLDIHFSIPKDNPSEKDINQGTLVVFNLDPSVSNDDLRQIFTVYGEIKEIRESPQRSNRYKFIEYYDVRCADAALHALNKSDMRVKVEARGARRLLEQDDGAPYLQQSSSPSNNMGFSGAVPLGKITSASSFSGIDNMGGARVAPITPFLENAFHREMISSGIPAATTTLSSSLTRVVDSSHHDLPAQLKYTNYLHHPHSLPDAIYSKNNAVLSNSPGTTTMMTNFSGEKIENNLLHFTRNLELNDGSVFGNGSSSGSNGGGNYIWGNSHNQQQSVWPTNSPSFMNGVSVQQHMQQHLARAPSPSHQHMMHAMNHHLHHSRHHHVGSAPSVINPASIWDRRHSSSASFAAAAAAAAAGESPDTTIFHPASLGNSIHTHHHPHPFEFVASNNVFPRIVGMDLPSKGMVHNSSHHLIFPTRAHQIMPTSFDSSPNDRTRSRRSDGTVASNHHHQSDNKKQFELDIDRILRGEDKRTTLMIKNIPNKYTSKMLLAAIDERHRGTYDFIYLPIDFKNKCNVGYAFINMTDPSLIVPFYQAFNGKKWEKFNSEKVASLAYARIQGKTALIAHFQNSSLMNEDKRCRPILFNTDGPNAGDQVPFPIGVNVRSRTNKNRGSTSEEANFESSFDFANEDDSSFADSFTVDSAKDSKD